MIVLIAVGYVGEWDEMILSNCAEEMDLISEHFYCQDWNGTGLLNHTSQLSKEIKRISDAHRKYRSEISVLQDKNIKICMDEWNYWYGPHIYGELGTRYFLRDGLGVASGINEFLRNSDLVFMANYAQTVNVIGCIKTNTTDACYAATGEVLKMYRHHFGTIPIKISSDTRPFDVAAALDLQNKTIQRKYCSFGFEDIVEEICNLSRVTIFAVFKDMDKTTVYFTNLRTSAKMPLVKKMEAVAKAAGFDQIDFNNKFVAIKIHFGEPGNLAFLRPNYAAKMAEMIRNRGGKPFLTDCNTLYSGGRSNAVDHLKSAMENGYNRISANADIIIADGLKGTDYKELPIEGGKYCKNAKIGSAICDSDIIVAMSHFKGHEQTGFGGAIKNMGMGCASVPGKLELHSSSAPIIDTKNCIGCNICVKHCAHNALHLNDEKRAEIDYNKCVGCGQCVALCQYNGAVVKDWDGTEILNCKIAEYTKAIVSTKPCFYINFIVNVSPECDCWCHNDAAFVPDIGIAASFDPVALDKACADMVMNVSQISGSKLADLRPKDDLCGVDKFHLIHPDTDWKFGIYYSEKIGIGNSNYTLVTI